MLGHALIFDGLKAFADYEAAEIQACNFAFYDAGLPWIWDAQTIASFKGEENIAERIRLYAAETSDELTSLEIEALSNSVLAFFTTRISRFGVPLRPGVEQMIKRARKKGSQIGLVSRSKLAPIIRLYAPSGLGLNALAPDVAAVARILDTVEMEVVKADKAARLVEIAA